VNEPAGGSHHALLLASALLVLAYRAAMAALLAAFHAVPSLQRRRLLEEGAFANPLLEELLERPHRLGMGLNLTSQGLLVLLLGLLWPLRLALPGGVWVLTGFTLLYIWALDLALPTLLTAHEPSRWIARLFPLYAPAHHLLSPLFMPIARVLERRREVFDRAREEDEEDVTEDAVTAFLEEGEAEGILEESDRELIRNVVTFGDTVVREVMTPRTRIKGLPVNCTAPEAWEAFRETRHARLPLYEGSIDHIKGILLLKDLMQVDIAQAVPADLMLPPVFVPESKAVPDLLRQFQKERCQLAVVVDEFGTVTGVASTEDLLEEVFGEIQEEHEGQKDFVEAEAGVYFVSGHTHVEDLESRLGLSFERDGFDTLGGLVMAHLGRVPSAGERVAVEGAELTVIRMEGHRVAQVKVELKPSEADSP
jgi:CBS domain containing-hemolysin-like protein